MSYFAFDGGLDLVSSTLEVKPGRAITLHNYGLDASGNPQSLRGYEAFDGRPSPAEQTYKTLYFELADTEILSGDTLVGATSADEAECLADAVLTSGTYLGGDAAGYVFVRNTSDTWVVDEDLEVGASYVAALTEIPINGGAYTIVDDTTMREATIEMQRQQIDPVPGEGPTRGVFHFNGEVFAVRDDLGGASGVLYKSTSSGWEEVTLGETIDFTTGTAEVSEGETLTGGSGGATATVERVIVQSGTWGGGDAAGYLVLSGRSGTFQSEVGTTAGGSASLAGASSAIVLPPGGKYRVRRYNFYGHTDRQRIYGVNRVGNGFEFDGAVWTPIRTGMANDIPNNLMKHHNHLCFSFPGGSFQSSATGVPLVWSVIVGAAEQTTGKEITGMVSTDTEAVLTCMDEIYVLYGDSQLNWDLRLHSDTLGLEMDSLQRIGARHVFMTPFGITNMKAAEQLGNFALATITEHVQPLIKTFAGRVQESWTVPELNQYRLIIDDGYGMSLTFRENSLLGVSTFHYPDRIHSAFTDRWTDNKLRTFAAGDDGWVYHLEKGTSFNGAPVDSYYRPHFNNFRRPAQKKRFRRTHLEVDAPVNTRLHVQPEFDLGDPRVSAARVHDLELIGGGGLWNVDNWNEFLWSTAQTANPVLDTPGSAVSISFLVYSSATMAEPHTLYGATVDLNLRGKQR